MGGRKSRQSARTGDQKMYANRNRGSVSKDEEEDPFEDAEKFQTKREMDQDEILFDADPKDDDEDVYGGNVEGVFDLAAVEASDDDGDSSSSSGSDDSRSMSGSQSERDSSSIDGSMEDDVSSSDEDDDLDQMRADLEAPTTAEELMHWGKKKRDYYHGDTADLEIGQDEEDAILEEEAADEVLNTRYDQMDEEDYMLHSDNEKKDEYAVGNKAKVSKIGATKKTSLTMTLADAFNILPTSRDAIDQLTLPTKGSKKSLESLSIEEQRGRIQSEHAEYFPLINHFKDSVSELSHVLLPVAEQLSSKENCEAVGTTEEGKDYLHHKKLLLLNTALNMTTYLLLKNEKNTNIQSHPIIARLNACDEAASKLEDRIESPLGLDSQFNAIIKAASLMNGEQLSESEDTDESSVELHTEKSDNLEAERQQENNSDQESDSEQTSEDDETLQDEVKNEARFGIRPQDLVETKLEKKKKRLHHDIGKSQIAVDFGDESDDERAVRAKRGLSATMNAITQRGQVASRKAEGIGAEATDEVKGRQSNSHLQSALDMMDEMLGKGSDENEDNEEDDIDEELDGDEFYSAIKKSKRQKKEAKQSMYTVAPKYPTVEEVVEGERAISKKILKNRGLVAHKAKINRNPRVKKREQYRKALIRRKGAHREVRTGEVDQYGGEVTGIKSGVSRSRKLRS